jgi:hypothetical protein
MKIISRKGLFLVLIIVSLLALVSVGISLVNYKLKQSGITWDTLSVDSSGKILVNDLLFHDESMTFRVDQAEITFSWIKLLGKEINISRFNLKNVSLEAIPSISNTKTESTQIISLPEITISHVEIDTLEMVMNMDSGLVTSRLDRLQIQSIELTEGYSIEQVRLINPSIDLSKIPVRETDTASYDNPLANLSRIPRFKLGNLDIDNGSLLLSRESEINTISNLNLKLFASKPAQELSARIEELNLTLNDSIEFDFKLEGKADPRHIELEHINLMIPGAQFNVRRILYADPIVSLELDPSHLSFGWLKMIYPDIMLAMDPAIPNDSLIYFQGSVDIYRDSLTLEELSVGFLSGTQTDISGLISWVEPKGEFVLHYNNVRSNRNDLRQFLYPEDFYDFFQWPNEIDGHVVMSGNSEYYDISGTLSSDFGILKASTLIYYDSMDILNYSISVKSSDARIDGFVDYIPLQLSGNELDLFINGKDDTNNTFTLNIDLSGVEISEIILNKIAFEYAYENAIDSLHLRVNDEKIQAEFHATLLYDQILSFKDSVDLLIYEAELDVPDLGAISPLPELDLATGVEGQLSWKQEWLYNDLHFHNGVAIKDGSRSMNSGPIKMEFGLETEKDSMITFKVVNEANYLDTKISKDAIDQLSRNIRESLNHIEKIDAHFAIDIDSAWTKKLFDYPVNINIEQLDLAVKKGRITSRISIPEIETSELLIRDVTTTAFIDKGRQEMDLSIDSIQSSILNLTDLRLGYFPLSDSTNYFEIFGRLPNPKERIDVGIISSYNKDANTFKLKFAEDKRIIIIDSTWQIVSNDGAVFDMENLNLLASDLKVQSNRTGAFLYAGTDQIHFGIDDLYINRLLNALLPGNEVFGIMDGEMFYYKNTKELEWNTRFDQLLINDLETNDVKITGRLDPLKIQAKVTFEKENSEVNILASKQANSYDSISIYVRSLNLQTLNQVEPFRSNFSVNGQLNADLDISMANRNLNGMIALDSGSFMVKETGSFFSLSSDTLSFADGSIHFEDFTVYDIKNQPLVISGDLIIFPELLIDLQLATDHFNLLANESDTSRVTGSVISSTNLSIDGDFDRIRISGEGKLHENSYMNYTYHEVISMVDPTQIVTFHDHEESKVMIPRDQSDLIIDLDIAYELEPFRIRILLNEDTQEFLEAEGTGSLKIEGTTLQPEFFGTFQANSGLAYIVPPAVPDLRMVIEKAELKWTGNPYEPIIDFSGIDTRKAAVSGLSSQFMERTDQADFDIYVTLDHVTPDRLDFDFDLKSDDPQAADFLRSLPKEQRKALALNLLVFGYFGNDDNSDVSMLLSSTVSKLNEIANRNIKNGNLYFSASDRSNISYQYSFNFLDNKLKLAVGGNLGLFDHHSNISSTAQILGNFRITYELSQSPNILLRGNRSIVDEGIIDGAVIETSLGVQWSKRFDQLRLKKGEND